MYTIRKAPMQRLTSTRIAPTLNHTLKKHYKIIKTNNFKHSLINNQYILIKQPIYHLTNKYMHWHFYFQFFVFSPLTCKTIIKNYNETVILFNIIIFRKPKSILRLYITTLWKKDWESKWERWTYRHQLLHIFLNTRTSTC